jgi:superfamily II DNA or RNA helicase
MSLNIRVEPLGLFSPVYGFAEELDLFEDTLLDWSRQFDPHGKGRSVFKRQDDETLLVLTGALIALRPEDCVPAEAATPCVEPLRGLLRDYQADAVAAAYSALLWRSIVQAPGGAGKTHIAAGIVAMGVQHGISEWLYLVQNRELAAQTQRVFDSTIPQMAELLGGGDLAVTCASYGTVPDEALRRAQGLIIDEVHGEAARTRAAVVAQAESVRFRCGMSATPLLRQDAGNALVVGLLGPVVYMIDPDVLIREGHLAQGRFHLICL